jgi:competence protein ComEA
LIYALEAAGGSIPEADLEAVNLALRVQDEAQYKIPRMGDTPDPESNVVSALAASQKPLSDKGQSSGGLIELNKASAELLETLPGIGPVRAGDIVADRELNGPFLSIEQITRVQGIGPAILGEIRELVTVGEGP